MAISPALYSSRSEEWETPADFFAALDAELGFTLDACAGPHNAKCPRYYTREQDALRQPWSGIVFCNPPYGRTVDRWLRKAYESARAGATVVCLVPARTDTAWFHDWVLDKAELRFVRGRLAFSGSNGAPFPSLVAIYRPTHQFCPLPPAPSNGGAARPHRPG